MGVKVKSDQPIVTDGTLLIGELADRTGASARSLRHYETNGLLRSRRDLNGYRRYDGATVQVVGRIRRLLAAGFNLQTVRLLLPCLAEDGPLEMCPAIAAQIRAAFIEIEDQHDELVRRRASIESLLQIQGA